MNKNFTPKKILGIHWRWSDINKTSWKERQILFENKWMRLDLFQFPMLEDPSFKDWEKVFNKIDFSLYDAIYTSSLWWVMTLRYMAENNLHTKRIVMAVPGISFKTLDWKKANLYDLNQEFLKLNSSNVAYEKIVISFMDDDVVPFQSWKEVAEKVNWKYILLEKWWHKMLWSMNLIVDLVKNWLDK